MSSPKSQGEREGQREDVIQRGWMPQKNTRRAHKRGTSDVGSYLNYLNCALCLASPSLPSFSVLRTVP